MRQGGERFPSASGRSSEAKPKRCGIGARSAQALQHIVFIVATPPGREGERVERMMAQREDCVLVCAQAAT